MCSRCAVVYGGDGYCSSRYSTHFSFSMQRHLLFLSCDLFGRLMAAFDVLTWFPSDRKNEGVGVSIPADALLAIGKHESGPADRV